MRLLLLFSSGLCYSAAFTTVSPGSSRSSHTGAKDVLSSTDLAATRVKIPLLGRFRKKKGIKQSETISLGDSLPEGADLTTVEGEPVGLVEAFGEGKSILVGMPGAFTPTCTKVHLPGYVESIPDFQKLGFSTVGCLTTNDRFVNDEWGQVVGIKKPQSPDDSAMQIFCDADGDVVKSLGLADDMGFGVGVRSKRFAMALEDGKVTHLLLDEGMDDCEATSASNLLEILSPKLDGAMSSEMDPNVVLGSAIVVIALVAALQYVPTDFTT